MSIPNDASLVLDSEPLSSGDCRVDLATYRYHLRKAHDELAEMGSRPEWGVLASAVGVALLIGILLGWLGARAR